MANNEMQMCKAPNPCRYVLERSVDRSPGEAFNYVTGSSTLLGAVLYKYKLPGKPFDVLEREVRFDPLGISDIAGTHFDNRDPVGCGGSRMRPRDLATIGQLVALPGQWDDRQVVPAGLDRTGDGAAAQRLFDVLLQLSVVDWPILAPRAPDRFGSPGVALAACG